MKDLVISSISAPHKDHLLLPCTIVLNKNKFASHAFLECGATDNFYDLDSAQKRNLPLTVLSLPRQLYLVDGSLAACITHTTTIKIDIMGHKESVTFFLTNLGKYELILGRKWLRKHNPLVNWAQDVVSFNSEYCKTYCFQSNIRQITVPSFKSHLSTINCELNGYSKGRPRKVGAAAFQTLSKQPNVKIFSLSLYEVNKRLRDLGVRVDSQTPDLPSVNPPTSPTPVQKMLHELQPFYNEL